jgi:hypothetical protein
MTDIAKIAAGLTRAQREAKEWRFLAYLFSGCFLYWLIDGTDESRAGVCLVLAFICWAVTDIIGALTREGEAS